MLRTTEVRNKVTFVESGPIMKGAEMQSTECGSDGLSNWELLFGQVQNIISVSGNCRLNVIKVTGQSQGEEEEDYRSGSSMMS